MTYLEKLAVEQAAEASADANPLLWRYQVPVFLHGPAAATKARIAYLGIIDGIRRAELSPYGRPWIFRVHAADEHSAAAALHAAVRPEDKRPILRIELVKLCRESTSEHASRHPDGVPREAAGLEPWHA